MSSENHHHHHHHPPLTLHDVYHTAFLLQQVLIADLVPPILNLAEYWALISSTRRQDRISCTDGTNGQPYLTVDTGVTGGRPVRRVEFRITGHEHGWSEQGWSDYRRRHPYMSDEQTHTWFTAVVRHQSQQVIEESEGSSSPPLTLTTTTSNSMKLGTNPHAPHREHTHLVAWTWDAEDRMARGAVRSLGPGTELSVEPWARSPGCQNIVSSVEIDIYVACVRRL